MSLTRLTFTSFFTRRVSTVPCILNGKDVIGLSKVPVVSHNGVLLHNYAPLDRPLEKVDEICINANSGFHEWSARSSEERRDIFMAAALIIEKNRQLYIDAHTEIGGPAAFAEFGVAGAVASCKEYAMHMTRPFGLSLQTQQADFAITHQTPIGPVLAIAPWNAPTILWARAVMAPLAAGCSVVLKSCDKAPLPPYLLTQHLLQAGVDVEALQLVQVQPDENKAVVESFLQHKYIKKVNFTGSTAVGRQIAAVAAQNLKPALLELGGKNVAVICKDADLPKAASNVLFSAWFHKGQVCMCVDSVYVHEDVYDAFLAVLKTEAVKMMENPDFALNQRDSAAAEKVQQLVTEAVEKGAKVVFGNRLSEVSSNCSPIILTDVNDDMNLASEESFGPVFSVDKFHDMNVVIARINDQPHGLKASVWSSDVLSALETAKKLDFGGVHVNGSTIHDEPTVPHGAVKDSGSGRFNSVWGLEEFRYTKLITLSK